MASGNWSMRSYREGDEDKIRELFQLVFDRELSSERWNWMYRDNHTGVITITLAEGHGGELAGQYALRPVKLKVGNETLLGTLSLDTMVHPNYRGQGMFTKLARHMYDVVAQQGIPLTYGFPNENSYRGFVTKLEWVDLAAGIPVYAKVLNVDNVLRRRINSRILLGATGFVAKGALGLLGAFQNEKLPAGYRLRRVTEFDEGIDRLWEKASQSHQIMLVRDREYLNWRYVENPNVDYDIFVLEKGDEISGYMVLKRAEQYKLRIGYIADLLTAPEDALATGGLISEAVGHFRAQQVDIVSCLVLAHTQYARALRRKGFVHLPQKLMPRNIYLGVRRNTDEYPEEFVFDPTNWHVTWGDHDSV